MGHFLTYVYCWIYASFHLHDQLYLVDSQKVNCREYIRYFSTFLMVALVKLR